MQAVETSKVFLHAIDGGLARVNVRMLAGAAAAEDADFLDALDALGRVLDASDTGLALDATPAVHGPGYDAGLLVSGVLPAGSPSMIGRRVRSFAPAIKARTRGLDLFVMASPDAGAGEAATVAAAAAFARRFGRERLCVVVADDVKEALPGIAASDCGMTLEVRGVAEVCGALAAGTTSCDALLVPEAFLETVTAVAAAVCGTSSLVTECASHEDAVIVSSGLAGASALPTLPGLILAVAELLVALGRVEAAVRLADAWCRAVETGVRTADFDVTHPYARLVDDAGFAAALIECMGEAPRTLRRHFEALATSDRRTKAARPAMRVIRGGR